MGPPLDCATLLSGGSLRVVLYPDSSRPDVWASVESLALPHVYIQGSRILGVSAYNHSWQLGDASYDPKQTAAYAYNNFCDLVFNASLELGVVRGYHVSLYEKVEFVITPDYEEIWRVGADSTIDRVGDAVRAGRRLKVMLEADDGLIVIHPVHMAEVALDNSGFTCFTDQTAHPACFRSLESVQTISDGVAGRISEMMRIERVKNPAAVVNFDMPNPQFESAYYIVRADGMAARGQNLGEELEFAKYRSITIFASRDPAA